MKLYGKCEQEFEKWFLNKYRKLGCQKGYVYIGSIKIRLDLFYDLPESMQIGVYEDYFYSVGIEFYVNPVYGSEHGNKYVVYIYNTSIFTKTKKSTRTAAIKKACEIRNEQLNDLE